MIVVTGGTGFLGAHLICKLMQSGVDVKALKRESSSTDRFEQIFRYYFPGMALNNASLQWVDCDVTDIIGLHDNIGEDDCVYHCAAEVHFRPGNEKQQFQVNVLGTANMVDVCLEKKVRKLVHVSSIGSLGDSVGGYPVDEDTVRKKSVKQSSYSKSKYLGELEVFRGIAEGLNAVIVNPSVIIGPGEAGNGFSTLIGMVQKGLRYYPQGANAWVDVRDVAEAMILLMQAEIEGERFIVSAENRSYQYILEQIAEILGVKPPVKKASYNLLKLAGLAGKIKETFTRKPNPLTPDLIRISSSVTAYNPSKLIGATGFRYIPVIQSLKETCSFNATR